MSAAHLLPAICSATSPWLAALILLLPRASRAEHCPPLPPAPSPRLETPAAGGAWSGPVFSARLDAETARYARPLVAGNWAGVTTELGANWSRWQARGWLGAFQLDHNGTIDQGVGDAGLELRATVWRRDDMAVPFALGPALALTLPTGDADSGFGMGHTMAIPGLWWSLPGSRLRAGGALAYGRALADPEGHHHGTGPIIDPMNRSELMTSAGIDLALAWQLRGQLTASYAHPLVDDGTARGTGGVGLLWTGQRLRVNATVQLPLVGDPFQVRTVIGAAVQL
jgi:hypothetical protein